MKKLLLLAVSICVTLTLTALAQTTGEVPVTSTITDSVMVAGTPFHMQIRSDLGGPYQSVKTKKGYQVKSLIIGTGNWELDTGINVTSPTRHAFLDFSKGIGPIGPGGAAPSPPFTAALVRPKLYSLGYQYGYSMLTMGDGETQSIPLLIGFDDLATGVRYRIHMTPDARSNFPYPETDEVDITCTGVDANSKCNQWQIRPNGLKGGCATGDFPCSVKQNVVRLVKLVSYRGGFAEVNQGNFLMSFAFDITRP